MRKNDDDFLREIFQKAEEKERAAKLAKALLQETEQPSGFPEFFIEAVRQLGLRGVCGGMADVLVLAFAVTVLCFGFLFRLRGGDDRMLLSAVFISAPLLYAAIFLFSWLKEKQNGTYGLSQSFKFTFFHMLALRMFTGSLLGIFVNGVYALFLALRFEAEGLRVFAVSFTSLMLFSLILLVGIIKGRSIKKGLLAGGVWTAANMAASVMLMPLYAEALSKLPLYVLFAVGVVSFGCYVRKLTCLTEISFRKEYADAEN